MKATARGKSRIRATPQQRRRLAAAMAVDTLSAATASPLVRRVLVVAEDESDAAAVGALPGVEVRLTATTELNAAILDGLSLLRPEEGPVAVLPADLPGLDPDDLTRVLELCAHLVFAVVPDRSGSGTTILTGRRTTDVNPAYGLSSFARHQAAGAVPVAVPARSTVRADVDTLAEALACGGMHTMAVLAEFAPVAGATAAARGRSDQVDGSHRWVPGS